MNNRIVHAGARGVRQQWLFSVKSEFEDFLGMVGDAAIILGVWIINFAILNNHYHFLLDLPLEVQTEFFKKINCTYAKLFNKRKDQPGHVFDPRTWVFERWGEALMAFVSRYIDLNPKKAGLIENPADYEFCGYGAIIGARPRPIWFSPDPLLEVFGNNPLEYQKYVELGLSVSASAWAIVERVMNRCTNTIQGENLRDKLELSALAAVTIARSETAQALGLRHEELMLFTMRELTQLSHESISAMLEIPRRTLSHRIQKLQERFKREPELRTKFEEAMQHALLGQRPAETLIV